MQAFRSGHAHDLPDTTDLVKKKLQQLQAALRSSLQRQIQWQVHKVLDDAEIKKRIKMTVWVSAIACILMIAVTVFLMSDFLGNELLGGIFMMMIVGIIILNIFIFIGVSFKTMRQKNQIETTTMLLDWDRQHILLKTGPKNQYQLKFHSQHTLPAFILPHNADDDLRRLRDDVQNRLTQITGLNFS